MSFVLGSIAGLTIPLGFLFILSKTVTIMPNKVCRFVFLFALLVPFDFAMNYINIWAFGYHKIGWGGALIIALPLAAYGTFLPLQPHDSNRP